jgi:hypothetical protein
MNGMEIVMIGFISGFFFGGCYYFIKGLIKIYKDYLNK